MAYQVPPRWAHGNTLSAANLNKYSDGLNDIHTVIGDQVFVQAVPLVITQWSVHKVWVGQAVNKTAWLTMPHKARYLCYQGEGKLESYNGDKTTLSNQAAFNVFDLETVDWLWYGRLYKITGCTMAVEFSI